jgi:hypothetical protein
LALSDAADIGDYLRGLLFEMQNPAADPRDSEQLGVRVCWATDSKDLYDRLTRDGPAALAEKRLALELIILRELLDRPGCNVFWVSTEQMLADILAKATAPPDYLRMRLREARWCLTEQAGVAKAPKAWRAFA